MLAAPRRKRQLGDIFVDFGLVTSDQLEVAVERQRQSKSHVSIGDVLVSLNMVGEKDKVRCLAEQWGVPFMDLVEYQPDPDLMRLISQEMARRLKCLPIAQTDGRLTLAMKNPLDIYAIDEVRLISGMEVDAVIASEEEIAAAVAHAYRDDNDVSDAVNTAIADLSVGDDFGISINQSDKETDEVSLDQLKSAAQDAPVVRMVNLIITQAIQEKTSDIHIEPMKDHVRVRYRIDGIMQEGMKLPKTAQASLVSRVKIMSEMDISEKRAPQDGRISLIIDGKEFDFRVSSLPSVFGEKIVMRILDKSSISIGLSKLGLLPDMMEKFEQVITRSYGIILVTGPTGSGKSTTLYSVLNKINTGDRNIITIEDPVEYNLAGITQAQVNVRAGMTFASGLRTMLRQDPDIIMVGEIRDSETALIATEAALTGHLVLSTLHTNDAPGSITRLVDMGIESFLIASSLAGVIAQRLLRTICPKCKEAYSPSKQAMVNLGLEADSNVQFFRGRGCPQCRGTGYKGRVGVYELMSINDEMRELILKKVGGPELQQAALRGGMRTLREDAMEKILLGITTLEESLRVLYVG
ncbi:MAG TPA: type II secretion system ATPase GspE [Armatimonadota bacterium]